MDHEQKRRRRRAIKSLAAGAASLVLGLVLAFGWIDGGGVVGWVRPRVLWLGALAAAAVLMTVGTRAWWSAAPDPDKGDRAAGLSWGTVVTAGLVVGVVAWGATNWLLAEASQASTADVKATAKVDAIKTGLGIGAGTTGIFALLLAIRRQNHQERTAADTFHDATERRVTELYTKAADQLGSPKAAVRLAGLYALERLGQRHKEQRGTILALLCAYLRMRYTEFDPPDDTADSATFDRYENQLQEAQVRAAALIILVRHHRRYQGGQRYWRGVLDLAGAYLVGANLADLDLAGASMTRARLMGASLENANLHGANLTTADLVGAHLYCADLRKAQLHSADLSHANLSSANLETADLGNARLDGAVVNDGTRIDLPAEYRFQDLASGKRLIQRREDP